MKKILSFLLAALMLVSMVPTVMAADVDVSEGTTIKVVGTGADTYTVTVPAKLAPGESGTVKANGTWPSNQTLNVTAPSSVTLTHGTQTMDVGITFDGISQVGSDTGSVSTEQTVAVASASSLFGTWTGLLTYTVEMVQEEPEVEAVAYAFTAADYDAKMGTTTATDAEVVIPETFTYDGTTYKVTSIDEKAFYNCTSLTSITIPDSVTEIAESAFMSCTSLTSITIPDSVTEIAKSALSRCNNLTSVTFGKNSKLTEIGDFAFYNCTSLTSIDIPDGVTTIGDYAFNTSGLTSVGPVGSGASIEIPDSITSIGVKVFESCKGLASVIIPDGVTSIGESAFYCCDNMTSVTFGKNSKLTEIGAYAFGICDSLTSVDIPDGVTTIDKYAFSDCTSLTSITIPDSVTEIAKSAFSRCGQLKTVNYTGTETQWAALLENIDNTQNSNDYLINATINYNYVAE